MQIARNLMFRATGLCLNDEIVQPVQPRGLGGGFGDNAGEGWCESQQQQVRGHGRSPSLAIPWRFPNFLVVVETYIATAAVFYFTQCEMSPMCCGHGEAEIALFAAIRREFRRRAAPDCRKRPGI